MKSMHQLIERQKHADHRDTGIELDLVIPALNEERRIGATIAAVIQKAHESELRLRIVVVDNGCVDATAEVASSELYSDVPVEVISCRTRGKGAAVRAGISRSTAPYVGYCDADLSTPPAAIRLGVDLLRSGWEVVIGSRRCTGAEYSVPQGSLRQLGSFAFRKMASEFCGPVTDSQCGFKLFHSSVAKDLFAVTTLNGFAFDVELVAQARRRKYQMIELPVQWSDSPESSFRPVADGLRSFRELREIRGALARSSLETVET
jgi:dolichyl-phosphate beta-glucosyltransferase